MTVSEEDVDGMVAYLKMGGAYNEKSQMDREKIWVWFNMNEGKTWNWESKRWEKQNAMV